MGFALPVHSGWESMTPSGTKQHQPHISGRIATDELIRNMELDVLEMGSITLAHCVFSVHRHPGSYGRLAAVQDLIKEDAKPRLSARPSEWNSKSSLLRRGDARKTYRIAQNEASANGRRLACVVEVRMPDRAEISVTEE